MTDNTPPKYPKGTPRKHHFVPRGYLQGFCRGDTGRLAVFDRARTDYRDRQRVQDVAHIKDYYAYQVAPGELNFDIEQVLGKIESEALPVIAKIDARERIDATERSALALYVAFQHTRTPAFQLTTDALSCLLVQQLVQKAGMLPDGKRMTEEQIANQFGIELETPRSVSLRMMLELSPEIAQTLYEMDWLIAYCPDDRSAFLTTDNPFALIPGPDFVPTPFRGIGIRTSGVLKTLPLSRSSYLVIQNPGGHMYSRTLTRDQVRETNAGIAARCHNFVFGRDLALVERAIKTSGVDKTTWQANVTAS